MPEFLQPRKCETNIFKMPSARLFSLRVVQHCLAVVFCTVKQCGHSEDTRTALPKMVGTEYIIKR